MPQAAFPVDFREASCVNRSRAKGVRTYCGGWQLQYVYFAGASSCTGRPLAGWTASAHVCKFAREMWGH